MIKGGAEIGPGGVAMEGKKLLRVLGGEAVWPPPIWLMRQAGRYLPEYRALRAQAGDFIALCTNPALATEATLQPVRRFGLDAAILFSDILILPWALGHGLGFREGEGPVLPPVRNADAVEALDLSRLPQAVAPVLETVRRVRAELPEDAALIGFAGAPFTVACYMIEGGGSRDFPNVRRMAYEAPSLFARLMRRLTEATIEYLAGQVEAGAELVMLFDSWAGILPPALFDRHVIDPTEAIVAALRARFPALPVIGFPRLAGSQIGRYALETAVDAVAMDSTAQPEIVSALVPEGVALQGNLDPWVLAVGGEELHEQADDIVQALRGRPHIFNLGHGVLPHTPPEHVAALVQSVRDA